MLGRWPPVVAALVQPNAGPVLACALPIAFNWGIYIYAVESKQVLQASLALSHPAGECSTGMLVLREVGDYSLWRWACQPCHCDSIYHAG